MGRPAETQFLLQTLREPMVTGAPVAKEGHEQYHNHSDADRERCPVVH